MKGRGSNDCEFLKERLMSNECSGHTQQDIDASRVAIIKQSFHDACHFTSNCARHIREAFELTARQATHDLNRMLFSSFIDCFVKSNNLRN